MPEVEAGVRMDHIHQEIILAEQVAVETVEAVACLLLAQLTQEAVAAAIQAFMVQIDPAQMAVQASSSLKCHRLPMPHSQAA
jgi:hypothetical protein